MLHVSDYAIILGLGSGYFGILGCPEPPYKVGGSLLRKLYGNCVVVSILPRWEDGRLIHNTSHPPI
jgi:hypothetical protein